VTGSHSFDVLVIGSGASGLAAAVSADRAGARVGLATKGSIPPTTADLEISAVSTTSGHCTSKDGTCTTKTKFTDSFVEVAGTYTINGVTTAETGDVSTHTEKSKTTCRF